MDRKSVPILPSLITLGNVFLGFLAMAKAADAIWLGHEVTPEILRLFEVAVILIMYAMVLDALDGRVARMTGQTSAFGAHLDSLADVVTFGVAPAFVVKQLIDFHDSEPGGLLPAHPKLYYFCAAIYVLGAAMRLARFNSQSDESEESHQEFKGLPTPGAAAMICALVAFVCSREDTGNVLSRALLPVSAHDAMVVAMPATLVCLGLAMVSKLPYPHMFYTIVRRRHSYPFLATLVVLIGLAAIEWQVALLALTASYVLSGFVLGAYRLVRNGRIDPPSDADAGANRVRGLGEPQRN